ncbi:MAG: ARMT1-like domain-containing protein [Deltaproteobacteria bacterium]|nr:ARMT1-like domain-containing protein [Deltaproteobacteria bacterium]
MRIQPECIPCILTMSITAMRELGLQGDAEKELYGNILDIPWLRGRSWDITSPEVLERVMHVMMDATGRRDPFQEVKTLQNRRIMGIVPFLKSMLKAASDPLHTAVKLAILGNTIDLMMGNRPTDIENSIAERLREPVSDIEYQKFRRRLDKCRFLVYLGDNAGEIVFDRLLMETIRGLRDMDIVFIVRSVPALNDATMDEARSVGIHEISTIVENGIDGPCPGTVLCRCSQEVTELIHRADMVISKGGGNFDALEEEKGAVRDKITFMLLSKCTPYCNFFGVNLHQPILAHLGKVCSGNP